MTSPFLLYGLRIWIDGLEITEYNKEYKMSQIGKPTEKVTVKPETIPVPPKTTPAPMPEPIEQPVETPA